MTNSALPWDHPRATPMQDIAAFQARLYERGEGATILWIGPHAWDILTERLGHTPTVADIPPGAPGRWTEVRRMDPILDEAVDDD